MKKHLFLKLSLLLLLVIWNAHAWAVTYNPSGVAQQTMQSQQVMKTGGAYNGTVYEPFSNATPSEQSEVGASSPAKAPGGPRKGFYNPGEGGSQSTESPIGEPLVMILFALAFVGVIAVRQYKKSIKTTENSNNSTMKKYLSFKLLALLVVLITSINTAWADDHAMYVVGDPVNNWNNNTTYQISTGYGQDHKYYIVVYLEHNQCFALSKGDCRYAPSTQHTELYYGKSAVQGDYSHTDNSWQYTGPTGLVKICISQDGLADTYWPYVWVEKYWDPTDDINDVLTDSKVMFYYGHQFSGDYTYLHSSSGHNSQAAFCLVGSRRGDVYVGNSLWASCYKFGPASLSSANYYIYNEGNWDGVQLGENAQAGKAYILYNNSGSNAIGKSDNRGTATFTDFTDGDKYSIEYGTANSGVSAYPNYDESAINKSNSIYGYYISADNGSTWSSFDPSNASALAPSTAPNHYKVAAIVTDGVIYVKGATATLEVTETTYEVTVAAGANGSITSSTSVSAGAYTAPTISAQADDGYYFTGWEVTSGTASFGDASSASTTVKASSDATVTANFALRYAVVGSVYGTSVEGSGMPGWDDFTKTLEYYGSNDFRRTLTLEGNKKYKFRIKDLETGNILGYATEAAVTLNYAHTTFNQTSADVTFDLASIGSGEVEFKIDGFDNGYPQVVVNCTTSSWQITMDQKTVTDGCWTPVDNQGGSISAKDGCGFDITNGKYVRNGGSVTFKATPASGFQFDGWYSSSELSALLSMSEEYTISSISSAKTVYAKFKEITFMVYVSDNNNSRFEKVGTKSHPEITAVSPSGQVFARWDVYGTATVADPYSKTTTITGASDNSGDVIARFQDPPTLYYVIDKIPAGTWTPTEMYVYFYDNNYWNDSYGSGSKSGCLTHAGRAMTAVEGKNNRWWKYTFNPETDPDLAGHTIQTVSFMSKSQENYDNFNNSNTGTHRIYQSCMNMFIVTKSSGQALNGCWYYNDGYWYNYDGTKSGYYLHGLNDDAELIADESGNYSASVNLEANHDYYFYIGGCDGKNWANDETYKGNAHKHQVGIFNTVEGNENKIKLTTNVGGLYTFTLTPIYETVDEYAHMYLDITYPILAGDYRAVNTTPTKDLPSNTISSTSDGDTISLWLQAGNNVLAFKEAVVDGSTGALTWSGSTTQTVSVTKNGVYKMKLSKTGVSTFEVSDPEEYTGKFYIRTDCAPGKWKDYKQNSMTNNTLTFNTEDETTYDYYYCKWLKDEGSNVRFVVANKWNIAISDTLIHDAALGSGTEETLPQPASVRFSYNSYTNDVKRAYLSGSTDPNDRFLILHGNKISGDNKVLTSEGTTINYHNTYSNLNENEAYFEDKQNWVYQVNLQAKSGAAVYLTADYNGEDRDLYGSSSDLKPVLTSSDGGNSYPITAIYDFKTNNMMVAWRPGSGAIEDELTDLSSVMIVRDHQQAADQITFNGGSIEGSRVYGVMRFNKWTLNNQERTGSHATVYPSKSVYERALYWVSFPFNVRLKEVFGMGTYGIHWIMEYYDGAGRAERGWWVDSEANWRFYYTDSLQNGGPDGKGTILQANVGYVLGLDLDYFYTYNQDLWGDGAKADDAYLYFPSMSDNITITDVLPTSVSVPAHQCTIDRRINKSVANTDLDRRVVDSHWNVIGVPSYSNVENLDSVSNISNGSEYVAYPEGFGFYYRWNMETNRLDVTAKSTETIFKTMHGYMLQFAGTINWQTRKASLVAARERKRADHNLRLELLNGTTKQDHALLRITDDEGVTMRYDLNQDLCKESNAGANIWTLTDDTIPVAGNSLPFNEQITIVPVGVQIATDGEYTFSMPEEMNGVGVVLVDNVANTRTNMILTDYTVNLTADTYGDRFFLEISPIVQSPTGIEQTGSDRKDSVRKVMVDGILYIVKDGRIYDATGTRVQ